MLRFWIAFRILFGLSFLIDLNFVLTLALFTISIFTIFYVNMPDYIPHEIIDMILILGECRGNYKAAARLDRLDYVCTCEDINLNITDKLENNDFI